VLVVASCGSGSTGRRAPAQAFTTADRQLARLVEVRQDDVPADYRPHGSQQSGREKCAPDLSGLTLTALDRSTPLVARGAAGYVLGEVDFYKTAAQARSAFARVTGPVRLNCLLGIARSALSHYGQGRISIERLTLPAPPLTTIVARRFAERWHENGGQHTDTTDDVYVLAGRTAVILSFFRDRGVFPAPAEAKAVARVAARAARAQTRAKRTRAGGNGTKGE
jgi:hypothetical protein